MKRTTIPAALLAQLRAALSEDDGTERLARAIEILRDLDLRLEDRRTLATLRRELDAFRTITEAVVRGRSASRPDQRTLRAFGFDLSRRLQTLADALHEASYLVDSVAGHAPFEPGEPRQI